MRPVLERCRIRFSCHKDIAGPACLTCHVPRRKYCRRGSFEMQVRSCLSDTIALPHVSRFATFRPDVMHPSSTATGHGVSSTRPLGAQSGAQPYDVFVERKDGRQYEHIHRRTFAVQQTDAFLAGRTCLSSHFHFRNPTTGCLHSTTYQFQEDLTNLTDTAAITG